jgi:hypothetical protein
MVQVLEGEGAVALNRELMGATNPAEAKPGTIRADFAKSIDANAVHGSDSAQSAAREIAYFFKNDEICPAQLNVQPVRATSPHIQSAQPGLFRATPEELT